MINIKLTNDNMRDIIERDELGEALLLTITHNQIEDVILAQHWKDAETAINKIYKYLKVE